MPVYLMEAALNSPPRAVRVDAAASYYYSRLCSKSLHEIKTALRLPPPACLQLWLRTGSHPAGFSSPDQPSRDRKKTTCRLAECGAAGEMARGPADELPPTHHHHGPRVLLWVLGVSAEAACYKACNLPNALARTGRKKHHPITRNKRDLQTAREGMAAGFPMAMAQLILHH